MGKSIKLWSSKVFWLNKNFIQARLINKKKCLTLCYYFHVKLNVWAKEFYALTQTTNLLVWTLVTLAVKRFLLFANSFFNRFDSGITILTALSLIWAPLKFWKSVYIVASSMTLLPSAKEVWLAGDRVTDMWGDMLLKNDRSLFYRRVKVLKLILFAVCWILKYL